MWKHSFSEHNLEQCRTLPPDLPAPKLRYVPLGFLDDAARATTTTTTSPPPGPSSSTPRINHTRSAAAGPLLFFGNSLEVGRRRCVRALRSALGPLNFATTFEVFSDAAFVRDVLDRYNIFANLHKVSLYTLLLAPVLWRPTSHGHGYMHNMPYPYPYAHAHAHVRVRSSH